MTKQARRGSADGLKHLALAGCFVLGSLPMNSRALDATLAVTVRVTIVPSSGVCGTVSAGPAVGVDCSGGSPAIPQVNSVPEAVAPPEEGELLGGNAATDDPFRYRHQATLPGLFGRYDRLDLYTGGVEISSWRTVYLDNRPYVELTISW